MVVGESELTQQKIVYKQKENSNYLILSVLPYLLLGTTFDFAYSAR